MISIVKKIKLKINENRTKDNLARYIYQSGKRFLGINKLISLWQTAWWKVMTRGKEFIPFVTPYRFTIFLPSNSVLSQEIYYNRYEKDELYFLKKYLRTGDMFFDVGANIGLYTLLASSCVGELGCVYSFEPNAASFSVLKKNVTANKFKNVQLFPIAITTDSRVRDLQVVRGKHEAWTSLYQPTQGGDLSKQSINCLSLDGFVSRFNSVKKIQFIKIDIEGAEYDLLLGGKSFLSTENAPVLQVEFTDANLRGAGRSARELYDLLLKLGYKIYTYSRKENRLIAESLRGHYPYINLYAVKRLDAVLERIGNK